MRKCRVWGAGLFRTAIISLLGGGTATVSAASIGVDNAHATTDIFRLVSGDGFQQFRNVLTGMGHTIVPLNSFHTSDLAGLDAVILRTAYQQNAQPRYSADEQTRDHDDGAFPRSDGVRRPGQRAIGARSGTLRRDRGGRAGDGVACWTRSMPGTDKALPFGSRRNRRRR